MAHAFKQGQDSNLVISHHTLTTMLLHQRHALAWKRSIPNDIAQEDELLSPGLLGVFQHRLKRPKVGMNVGEDGD
jgi:hypothetical protein